MQSFTLHPDDETVLHTRFRSAVAWALAEELERTGVRVEFLAVAPDPLLERVRRDPLYLDDELRNFLAGTPSTPDTPSRARWGNVRSVVVAAGEFTYDLRGRLLRQHVNMYMTDVHNAPWDPGSASEMSVSPIESHKVRGVLWTERDDVALPLARYVADRLVDIDNPWPAFR